MNPENITALTCAGINYCALANNHTIDWGYKGLRDTIRTLENADIQHSGAGVNIEEATKPATLIKDNARYSFSHLEQNQRNSFLMGS